MNLKLKSFLPRKRLTLATLPEIINHPPCNLKIKPSTTGEEELTYKRAEYSAVPVGKVICYQYPLIDGAISEESEVVIDHLIHLYLNSRLQQISCIGEIHEASYQPHALYYLTGRELLQIEGDPLVQNLCQRGYNKKEKVLQKIKGGDKKS